LATTFDGLRCGPFCGKRIGSPPNERPFVKQRQSTLTRSPAP
jgi:hypothetical protein